MRILSFCKKWKKLEQRYFSTLIEYVDYAWNVVKDNLIRLYPQYGEYRDIPYTDRRYKLFKETIETGKGR